MYFEYTRKKNPSHTIWLHCRKEQRLKKKTCHFNNDRWNFGRYYANKNHCEGHLLPFMVVIIPDEKLTANSFVMPVTFKVLRTLFVNPPSPVFGFFWRYRKLALEVEPGFTMLGNMIGFKNIDSRICKECEKKTLPCQLVLFTIERRMSNPIWIIARIPKDTLLYLQIPTENKRWSTNWLDCKWVS